MKQHESYTGTFEINLYTHAILQHVSTLAVAGSSPAPLLRHHPGICPSKTTRCTWPGYNAEYLNRFAKQMFVNIIIFICTCPVAHAHASLITPNGYSLLLVIDTSSTVAKSDQNRWSPVSICYLPFIFVIINFCQLSSAITQLALILNHRQLSTLIDS